MAQSPTGQTPSDVLKLPVDLRFRAEGRQVLVLRLTFDIGGRVLLRSVGDSGDYETLARLDLSTGDLETKGTLTQGVSF